MTSAVTVVSLPQANFIEALGDLPGIELVEWDMTGPAPRDDIELVVPPYLSDPRRLARLAEVGSLRAVQLATAGYEHALPYLPSGVALANGRGVHDTSTAELAIGLAIAAQRGIAESVRAAEKGEWLRMAGRPSLADREVLVVGYGSIGREIVRRMDVLEAHCTVVASRARAGDDLVDTVHGIDELPDLLPAAEVVVLILPLTDASRHLVDDTFLAALPDDALIVNVARGGVVDTDALVRACASGRIRAALDVTDPEPLPQDHPLWTTPGVLITPHIGGASTAFDPRLLRLLREQLPQFAATGKLSHQVAEG
ncbi:2-hydroxyacid dehydrogenase [Calidifontibacter terrae]